MNCIAHYENKLTITKSVKGWYDKRSMNDIYYCLN